MDNPTDIIIRPELEALFRRDWERHRILFFTGPFGMGKTAVARALLAGKTVLEYNVAQDDLPPAPLTADCDVVLVDELQLLKDPEQQETLCAWMRDEPAKHFVLISRGIVPGWLMPFRFSGLLAVIEAQDLALDREAARRLLEKNGIDPSEGELTAIMQDVRGYPLAVAALCRHMAEGAPYSRELYELMERDLFHYIEDAVFHRFPVQLRQLLLSLAPFEEFDGELAKLVSGDSQVNDALTIILHDTTMLAGSSNSRYRFWPLFRRFLLWEMQQSCTPEVQRAIYSRAGLYYELHDDFSRALDCYSKGGEHGEVSRLLVKNAQRHPGAAHYYEMERYYFAMPREEILRSPTLMAGMSMLCAICIDFDGSEAWYKELQDYAARLQKSDANYLEARTRLTYLDIALPQRGSKGLVELIGTLFRAITDKRLQLPAFSVTSTLPSIMNGGKDFCEWSKSDDLLYATMRRSLETVFGRDGVGLADCAICESKFEKGEDVSSRVLTLMAQIGEIQRKGTPDIVFAAMGLVIRVQVMQGKARSALTALEELRDSFAEDGLTRFLPNMDAMRCRLWLRLGEEEQVARWLRESAPSIAPHIRALWRYQYITKAMAQIAAGAPDEALLSLAPLLPYCRRCSRTMDGLYLNLLMAICHYRLKDDSWEGELSAALDTAQEYHFITPVAQYGAAVLPLLLACRWNQDTQFFGHLLAATRQQTVYYPDFLRPAPSLETPLTPAETQVLKLLCHNRSNQEIADILGVKLPTVKSQVRSILQKLGVDRRSEAKEAAEKLHLV